METNISDVPTMNRVLGKKAFLLTCMQKKKGVLRIGCKNILTQVGHVKC